MTNYRQRAILWIVMLALAVPVMADARGGKLIGKVVDPEGNPIEGVSVIATCPEVSRFEERDTTDKNGVFKLNFRYLSVVYELRFEKEGYFPLDSKQDWDLEGTAREEFVMFPGEASVASAPLASTSNMAVHSFNQGVEAFNVKDYPTAETKFLEALEHDANLHQAWSALSSIYLKLERYQDAANAAEKAIDLGSTDESVWRSRWEAYRSLGDEEKTAQALLDLKDAGIRAEEAKRIHNEAVRLSKAGDSEGAFLKFQEALKLDPNLSPALLGLATVGISIGKDMEAASAAQSILVSDPTNDAALRIVYNAALNLGDQDMVINALVGLAAVEPVIARDSLLKLAFESYDANDMEQAATRFQKVLQVDANNAKCHYYLGLIFVSDGAKTEAKNHLEKFIQLAPDDPDAPTARELLSFMSGS